MATVIFGHYRSAIVAVTILANCINSYSRVGQSVRVVFRTFSNS